MKNLLHLVLKNIWWILLWYILNIIYLMHNKGVFDWTVLLVGIITAIGIVVFVDKDNLLG